MLRSNSKKARENIRAYIMDNFTPDSYGRDRGEFETFGAVAAYILETFRSEKKYEHFRSEQSAFISWCQGLSSVIDTCYYYNRSAVEDLGAIREETEAERNRYSEADAEKLLSNLIYRELLKGGETA